MFLSLAPVVRARNIAYQLFTAVFPRVRLVSAINRDCADPIPLLLIGEGWFLRHLGALFVSEPVEVWSTRVLLPRLGGFVRRHAKEFGLGFSVLPDWQRRLCGARGSYRGRLSVGQVLSLAGGWEDIRTRFSRQLRKSTRDFESRSGYSSRLSRSVQDFEFFYDRMYLPYAQGRFGEYAAWTSKAEMRGYFEQEGVLLIEWGGQVVAGQISTLDNGCYWARKLGILDGDPAHLDAGAMVAIYVFSIKRALDLGAREVDFGGGYPFLSSGVLQHKAWWGMKLCTLKREPQCFELFLGEDRLAARRFLSAHPTVVADGDDLAVLSAQMPAVGDARVEESGDRLRRWGRLGLLRARMLEEPDWVIHDLQEH